MKTTQRNSWRTQLSNRPGYTRGMAVSGSKGIVVAHTRNTDGALAIHTCKDAPKGSRRAVQKLGPAATKQLLNGADFSNAYFIIFA